MKTTALKNSLTPRGQVGLMKSPLQVQKSSRSYPSIKKDRSKEPLLNLKLAFSQENLSPLPSQEVLPCPNVLLDDDLDDLTRAESRLAKIEDPLWKHVCRDILNMMGPASLLKIWDSVLGEICFQAQDIEIFCKTKETAQFIQQYDFVILGSLYPYLPSLKTLRISVID